MRRTLRRATQVNLAALIAALSFAVALAAVAFAVFGLADRADDIQKSRADSVRSSCREQNARHDATIATLDRLLEQASQGASPRRAEQIERSRASTVLLIDALAPKRNCERRVRTLVALD